jgi:tetratricopeptide (TPR) repeat protein
MSGASLWRAAAALAGLLATACGPAGKTVGVQVADEDVRAGQAAALVGQGHYAAFKKAVLLYAELYPDRSLRRRVAVPYVEACLLLAMREKDLGIDNPAAVLAAELIVRENPELAGMSPYITLVSAMPVRTKGVLRDIDAGRWDREAVEILRAAEPEVRKRAASDGFAACVEAAWVCSAGRFGGFAEKAVDARAALEAYPDSLLMRYETAVCGDLRTDILEGLLERNPDFAEADYHLGEAEIGRGRLLEAESHLLKAFRAIPESPQPRILLAGIYFATEEFETSLQFYDLTLQISPEYRDALLGRAICLSYLGRRDEAMRELDRMLDLGYWLIGEAHYWLAWNLHGLERDQAAAEHIEEAKRRLPTNSEVFGLAGTIALDRGELERAEKDFLESLEYNAAGIESLVGLGTVASRKRRWADAGGFFERAGRACGDGAAALRAKIDELQRSALSEERKSGMIRRRRAQLGRVLLTEATAWYDAAAAFLNAGAREKALECVRKSAAHPALKDKSEELLKAIKPPLPD